MDSVSTDLQNHLTTFRMIGKKAAAEKFAIMIVGPADFAETLKESILDLNSEKQKFQMSVHWCESLEDILMSSQMCHADFIVFLLHTADRSCIESVERSVSVLDPLFFCSRLCFINCTSLLPLDMGIDPDQIFSLIDKYSVILLNGDIKKASECKVLAQRILYLSSSVSGVKTGFPLVFDLPQTEII